MVRWHEDEAKLSRTEESPRIRYMGGVQGKGDGGGNSQRETAVDESRKDMTDKEQGTKPTTVVARTCLCYSYRKLPQAAASSATFGGEPVLRGSFCLFVFYCLSNLLRGGTTATGMLPPRLTTKIYTKIRGIPFPFFVCDFLSRRLVSFASRAASRPLRRFATCFPFRFSMFLFSRPYFPFSVVHFPSSFLLSLGVGSQ